jgi:hypothetical protein
MTGAPSPATLRQQALAFLVATAAPEQQPLWRDARNYARSVLRALRRPGYTAARWDGPHLEEMARELAEWQRERYEPEGYYYNEHDHHNFAASRGGRSER